MAFFFLDIEAFLESAMLNISIYSFRNRKKFNLVISSKLGFVVNVHILIDIFLKLQARSSSLDGRKYHRHENSI
jgi:hypothetical protein